MSDPQRLDTELAEFLNPPLDAWHLDTYHARSSIVRAIREHLPEFFGVVLDIGCGRKPYMELLLAPPSRAVAYVGLDLAELRYHNAPDLLWDGWTVPLGDSSIDTAICTEVLEHCQDPARVLSETRRVLKPGGFFLLTVPFFWPLHDPPYDEYRFTPFALRRMLKQADFGAVEIWAMGGWDASLAQMIGLWVRRRPMRKITRRVLQKFLVPAYRWLLAIDRPQSAFDGSTMATGFCVTARAGTS